MSKDDPLFFLNDSILKNGGYVNSHSHLDRSYTVDMSDLNSNCLMNLKDKWLFVDNYKKNATEEDYFNNFKKALDNQKRMSSSVILSFIDIDDVVEYKAFNASIKAKKYAESIGIKLLLANQTLKGVTNKKSRKYIENCIDELDLIGSLPAADKDLDAHFEIVMDWAKSTNKRLHSHVDQLNTIAERETEKLALFTKKYNLESKVTAVHSISLACHPKLYRNKMYKLFQDVDLSFITCPSAWIDSVRSEEVTVTHNSVTPVDELIKYNLTVAIGSDNIHDVYKPFANGDMFVELRFLLESTHVYDIKTLVDICTVNGRRVLGI